MKDNSRTGKQEEGSRLNKQQSSEMFYPVSACSALARAVPFDAGFAFDKRLKSSCYVEQTRYLEPLREVAA